MRWAVLSAGVVVAAVLSQSGCSERTSPRGIEDGRTQTTGQAIQGGVTDTTDKFAVGVCIGPAGQCAYTCSGALILPNVVATARHCVDSTPPTINCTENPTFGKQLSQTYTVTTNTTMESAASGWYSVKSIAVPDDDHICGNDMALLVLSKSVPSAIATPIAPAVQYFMWDPAKNYDRSFSAIGFGATSPDGSGAGTRRIKDLISVLCIPGSPYEPCDSSVPDSEFVAGDGTCHGDSGSSAYESSSLGKGAPLSFGVLSRGADNGELCGVAVYSRFDKHRDWLLGVAKEASNNWSAYPAPEWTNFQPEPSPEVDAGGTKKDGGTKQSPKAELGEACKNNGDCTSNLCIDVGDGTLVCSSACDEENACADGFECRDNFCLSPAEGDPSTSEASTKKVTKSSCAASPAPAAAWPALALAALASVAAMRRRRRDPGLRSRRTAA